jgi:hypothetical protein
MPLLGFDADEVERTMTQYGPAEPVAYGCSVGLSRAASEFQRRRSHVRGRDAPLTARTNMMPPYVKAGFNLRYPGRPFLDRGSICPLTLLGGPRSRRRVGAGTSRRHPGRP